LRFLRFILNLWTFFPQIACRAMQSYAGDSYFLLCKCQWSYVTTNILSLKLFVLYSASWNGNIHALMDSKILNFNIYIKFVVLLCSVQRWRSILQYHVLQPKLNCTQRLTNSYFMLFCKNFRYNFKHNRWIAIEFSEWTEY